MMKCVSIGLAVGALATGLIAAWFWYRSSIVQPDPGWSVANPEPVIPELRQMAWNTAILAANTKSSDLNKTAALWTALSVALSGAASILGSLV
jgi:hypothetical protein